WMAGRNGPSSTGPLARIELRVSGPPPPMGRPGLPRKDHASPMRRSSIIAWLREVVLAWVPVVHSQEPSHDHQTDSGSRPTAAASRNGLVLDRRSLRARAHGPPLARGGAVVLLPLSRGRRQWLVVLWRRHRGRSAADAPAELAPGPRPIAGLRS